MNRIALIIALGSLPGIAGAQAQAGPSTQVRQVVAVPEPVVAITHVRVVDGTGAAPMEDQTIVLSNGKIQAVGKFGSVSPPAGARVMDFNGHTVIPGIVGMHDHTF